MFSASSLFFFLSTAFPFFFAHFTIHSCEWSCSLPFTLCIDDHGSFVICRAVSVRPHHLSDQKFAHYYYFKPPLPGQLPCRRSGVFSYRWADHCCANGCLETAMRWIFS